MAGGVAGGMAGVVAYVQIKRYRGIDVALDQVVGLHGDRRTILPRISDKWTVVIRAAVVIPPVPVIVLTLIISLLPGGRFTAVALEIPDDVLIMFLGGFDVTVPGLLLDVLDGRVHEIFKLLLGEHTIVADRIDELLFIDVHIAVLGILDDLDGERRG